MKPVGFCPSHILLYNLRYIASSMALQDLEGSILELLRRGALTPDEVAKKLRISWATANGHLLKLVGESKAVLVRKGRVNVYQAKVSSGGMFCVPTWIRTKSLEELSDELTQYFPRNITSAEMIEKERRKA
jgi:DNA-binding CsgD family transcriptional regulator